MEYEVLLSAFVLSLLTAIWASPLASKGSIRRRHGPVALPSGEDPDPEMNRRREFVKEMFKDAWDDYERSAWGQNELKPVSQGGWNGEDYANSKIGATIIDALDTLYIMGFHDEFQRGRDWIKENLDFDKVNTPVSVFETNIRIVGGLLSAYALSGDELFLKKAHEAASRMLPAFDTPTGLPYDRVNLQTGVPNKGATSLLAVVGTMHLEFVYLSHTTGDPIFRQKALKIRETLKKATKPNGLYYTIMSVLTGDFTSNTVSIGAQADSFYEYLLKAWVQLGDQEARELYDQAMNGFVNNGLVKVSRPSRLLYIAKSTNGQTQDVVEHLACFAGGMFALGAYTDPSPPGSGNRDRDMEIGLNFTNTCHESYVRTATNIGPDVFRFTSSREAEGGTGGDLKYLLRPEVIESYFVLYRITRDPIYREWGWEAAQAIQEYCKVGSSGGYSGIFNVNSDDPQMDDVQQTFFLAETLKYLYLLFSHPGLIDLDQWVFNTEAHPLPIKGANPIY